MTAQPTKLQLALARTIVQSKPENTTIRDYINHLRNHISSGTRPQFSATYEESQHNYLNSALHYKALLEESVEKEETLRNQLAAAEQEAEKLRAQLIAQEKPVAGRKRKVDELLEPATAKKSAHATVEDNSKAELGLAVTIKRIEQNSTIGDTLLRHIYYLRKEVKMHDIDHVHLSHLLGQTLRKAVTVVRSLHHELATTPQVTAYDRPEPSVVFQAFWKSFLPDMFAAMKKLDDGSYVTSSSSGHIIFEALVLFRAMMDYTTAAVKVAGTLHACQEAGQEGTSPLWSAKIIGNAEGVVKVMSNYVTQCVGLSDKPLSTDTPSSRRQPSSPTHAALLEGLMHLLLTRAGQLMYTLTFAAPFTSDLNEQMAGALRNDDQAVNAARLEAKLLTPLLRRLLPGTVHVDFLPDDRPSVDRASASPIKPNSAAKRESLQTCPATPSTRDKQRTRVTPHGLQTPSTSASSAALAQKYSLIAQPLNKIQNSLLKGMFGEEDNGGITGYTLRSPVKPRHTGVVDEESDDETDLDAGMTSHESGEGESFIMEMWCRVGWDVLAKGF